MLTQYLTIENYKNTVLQDSCQKNNRFESNLEPLI